MRNRISITTFHRRNFGDGFATGLAIFFKNRIMVGGEISPRLPAQPVDGLAQIIAKFHAPREQGRRGI
jgi:hypothetical protein